MYQMETFMPYEPSSLTWTTLNLPESRVFSDRCRPAPTHNMAVGHVIDSNDFRDSTLSVRSTSRVGDSEFLHQVEALEWGRRESYTFTAEPSKWSSVLSQVDETRTILGPGGFDFARVPLRSPSVRAPHVLYVAEHTRPSRPARTFPGAEIIRTNLDRKDNYLITKSVTGLGPEVKNLE